LIFSKLWRGLKGKGGTPLGQSTKIVAHHVGGRGLTVAFFIPPTFAEDIVNVLYEADADAVANAADDVAERQDFYLLPYGLGEKEGPATLYVTKNAYASSLYKPNSAYNDYSLEVELSGAIEGVSVSEARYDARMGNENEIVREVEIQLKSLDGLIAEGLTPAGTERPDVLSLDTQGHEHAILRGAEKAVRESVLAVATEVSFHPIYEDQPLFGDIQAFLEKRGMHFAGFYDLQEITPNLHPVTMRARGFLGFGDAVFLRRLDTLREIAPSDAEFHLAARKLAFIAINFGYFEYGLEALKLAGTVDPGADMAESMSKRRYITFTSALFNVMRHQRNYLLTDRHDIVEFCRRLEEINLTFRATRHPVAMSTNTAQDDDHYLTQTYYQQDPPTETTSDVEEILNSYGFTELAALVKSRRLKDHRYTALPQLRFVTVALNSEDMAVLLDASLPTILAPGNLPILAKSFNCEITIVATEALHAHATATPVFKELRRYAHIHCICADDLALADSNAAQTPAWIRGVADIGDDAIENWLMFFTSNTVFANGSFANVLDDLIDEKTRLILAPLYGCVKDPVGNYIRSMQEGNAPIAAIPHRALASLMLKNIPKSGLAGVINERNLYNDATDGFFRRVDDDTLVARQMRLGVVFIKPDHRLDALEALWDEGMLSEFCPGSEPITLADSDQFLAIDLVAPESRPPNQTETWPSDQIIAKNLQPRATRDRRMRGAISTLLHAGDVTDQVQKGREELDTFFNNIYASMGNHPAPHLKTNDWSTSVNSCALAARSYWRAERQRLSPIAGTPPNADTLVLCDQYMMVYPSRGVASVIIPTNSQFPPNIGATIIGTNFIPKDPENILRFTMTVNGYSATENSLIGLLYIDGVMVKQESCAIAAGEYTALEFDYWMYQNPGRRLVFEVKVGIAADGEIYLNGNESDIIVSSQESSLKICEYRRRI
jgi:FkbM family methyltransferase